MVSRLNARRVMPGVRRFLKKKFRRGIFEIESQDAPRFTDVARSETACLRMMTRLTIQWT
jgi:hypothetical protein